MAASLLRYFNEAVWGQSKATGSVGSEQVRTVIVVGTTGAGKSRAIKKLGGKHVETRKPPEVASGFGSCTQEPATYDVGVMDGARYHFVDTMGMLDTSGRDKEGIESIAHLMDHLSTVVGVIYVVAGRMNPAEAEICNFLFDKFFDDLDPRRLLVLRTKVDKWKVYNAQEDKDFLKQHTNVSKRIQDANFVAVDFQKGSWPHVNRKMTNKIL